MRLFDLLDGDSSQLSNVAAIKDLEITGLTCDSRKVNPGFLFAAIPGLHSDGRDYIDDAFKRGACAILAPVGTPGNGNVEVVSSTKLRGSLGALRTLFSSK